MYENLTKKLTELLGLAKAANKIIRQDRPQQIDPEKDAQVKALRATIGAFLKLSPDGGKSWNDPRHKQAHDDFQSALDKKLKEIETQNKSLNVEMGLADNILRKPGQREAGQAGRDKSKKYVPVTSPFTMEDAHSVLAMSHEDAKNHAFRLVHKSLLPNDHKGEIIYKISRTKNPVQLSQYMTNHVMNPRKTMGT